MILGYVGYTYYQANYYPKKDISKIEEKINRIHLEIDKKKAEKDALEKEKGWKKEVYEEWKKELETSS